MAMSKRSGGEKQEDIWIAHTELAVPPAISFFLVCARASCRFAMLAQASAKVITATAVNPGLLRNCRRA
jgi:hypothetical protein